MDLTLIDPELKAIVMEQLKPAVKKLTGEEIVMNGMTLRQHYTGVALSGLMAHYLSEHVTGWSDSGYAAQALTIADETIKALNETPNPNL